MNDIGGGPPSYKELLVFLGIMIFLAYWVIQMPNEIYLVKPKTLSECEEKLPRNQVCELYALPRFKADHRN